MRFEQLEYLIAIAETKSFSAAAQKLYVTQQAVSISMKQLEQELGQQLFIKENNKTILTAEGEKVLAFARNTLEEKTNLINDSTYKMLKNDCGKIRKILISSINTAKNNG